ncbi:2-dehydropantoate 2-reductase [Bradyrhizobium sp. STM 3843]|uniref:ketopantoate reductase family protein n=1 Tax=Bradyrhizobium sp. STM 3843 TaxID=551947 RepID=UPI0006825E3D|nr:2-dehydropantoate 2-reductase [Bradyrhizobium sp. STM 3843]
MFVGAGAVGGYFGGRLVQSGHDVSFLVRANRAGQIERDGLRISSPLGDYRTTPQFHLLDGIDPDTDVAIFSCKAYDLGRVVDELTDRLPAGCLILPLLNGLKHYQFLDGVFGAERVLGGLCHIGATLTDDGEILHSNTLQFFAYGPRSEGQRQACSALDADIGRASFSPKLSSDIMWDAWEKYAMLAAYAGVTCLMNGAIGEILALPGGLDILLEAFDETSRVAALSGYAPRARFRDETIATFSDVRSRGTSSMLRDMRKGRRVEADHILGDMVHRAAAMSVRAPILRAAYAAVKRYELAARETAAATCNR